MQTFDDAVSGFNKDPDNGTLRFLFGEKQEYELSLEPLLYENQFYVALYKDGELIIPKIPCKPGKNVRHL